MIELRDLTQILPPRIRVSGDFAGSHDYPNRITLATIEQEVLARTDNGMRPIDAFLTVADGVRNWHAQEPA